MIAKPSKQRKLPQHFLGYLPRCVPLAELVARALLILRSQLARPLRNRRIVSESRGNPHLHDITRLWTDSRDVVWVPSRIKLLPVQGVKDREIACPDIYLADGIAVHRYPQAISAFHLLIVDVTVTV